ncbi:MAG TPA: stage II sporulation protein M [Ilumatobacteraceae bacterium]|nr:stage II sporulation protein M [Ilumatobacteraceae bacterium]
MDLDAFVAAHQGAWWRLQQLTQQARSITRVSPDELDELVNLYQHVGAHLALARVQYAADTSLVNRLTLLVGDAHGVLYGQRDPEVRRGILHFVTVTYPAAIYALRRYIAVAALLTFVPWAAMQVWLSISPQAFDVIAPDAATDQYINQDFEDYYSNQPSQDFATQVFLNNVRVGFLAFAAGILLCVITAALLVWNGANGGVAGGLFTHVGQADKFWGLILPHGMLELSAVVVAAGLRIGWSLIAPGDRPRLHALTEEARRTGSVLVGLVAAFLLAALVEGFVTGKPWPTSVRIGIGVFVFLLFWGATIMFVVKAKRGGRADYAVDAPL